MIEQDLADIKNALRELQNEVARLTAPKPEEWLTISDTCEAFGLKPVTLRKLCSLGNVSSSKIGKKLLINRDSLLDYIATRSRKTIKEQVNNFLHGRKAV